MVSYGKIVTKCKGYPGKLDRNAYLSLIRGETITGLLVNKWYRSLRDYSVQIRWDLLSIKDSRYLRMEYGLILIPYFIISKLLGLLIW